MIENSLQDLGHSYSWLLLTQRMKEDCTEFQTNVLLHSDNFSKRIALIF